MGFPFIHGFMGFTMVCAKPAIPATFSVPALMLRSWDPPYIKGWIMLSLFMKKSRCLWVHEIYGRYPLRKTLLIVVHPQDICLSSVLHHNANRSLYVWHRLPTFSMSWMVPISLLPYINDTMVLEDPLDSRLCNSLKSIWPWRFTLSQMISMSAFSFCMCCKVCKTQ